MRNVGVIHVVLLCRGISDRGEFIDFESKHNFQTTAMIIG